MTLRSTFLLLAAACFCAPSAADDIAGARARLRASCASAWVAGNRTATSAARLGVTLSATDVNECLDFLIRFMPQRDLAQPASLS